MQALSGTSQRRSAAAKVALAIRQAKARKKVGNRVICEAAGIPRSNLGYYLTGRNLPTVQVAKLLADVLDAPDLVRIVLAARTVRCGRSGCPRSFVYEGGKPKVYCGEDCATLAAKMRAGDDPYDTGGKRLYDVVSAELEDARASGRPVRRGALDVGLTAYQQSDAKRHARFSTYERRIDGLRGAIDEMCAGCEPEGLCRTPDCALRAFSPLPLEGTFSAQREAAPLRRPEGSWGPSHRESQLAAIRSANERRWSHPGERERQSEQTKAHLASLSEQEREERGRRISAGIDPARRSAASRAVHAARREAMRP